MRVKKMEDLPPHNRLFEQMEFSGYWLPVYDGVNITYYKRYRQADITPPEPCERSYIDCNGEPELLRGTAAKIMLMREIIEKIGVGGQLSLGLE